MQAIEEGKALGGLADARVFSYNKLNASEDKKHMKWPKQLEA